MGKLSVVSNTHGEVVASEELLELLGEETIDALVGQLRLGGGSCAQCRATIHNVEDVSVVATLTAAGARASFVHLRCAPPQIIDNRRNRRAALAHDQYMKERVSDAQAFAGCRDHRAPHAFVVVSFEVALSERTESGDLVNPWIGLMLENGFELLMEPDLLDAAPDRVEGWGLRVEGDTVTCDSPMGALYTGGLSMPAPWLEAITTEQECLVLVAGLNIDSDVVGPGCEAALNALAARGLIAGGTVKVSGSLGAYGAQGLGVALADAARVESITGRTPGA